MSVFVVSGTGQRSAHFGLCGGGLSLPASIATLSTAPSFSIATQAAGAPWKGVSLGGWLVMEINPSHAGPDAPVDLRPHWMYDQIEAASELDFVRELRRSHGDA